MDLYDKLDRAVTKAFQPNALDKIIVGIAKPIEAGKLEDSLIVELNDRICRKQRSAPKGFYWDIEVTDKIYREQTSLPKKFDWLMFSFIAFALSLLLYKIFLDFDSILIRIISVIMYIAICIGGGMIL